MQNKKYGIWKIRYAYFSRKCFKGWLIINSRPLFFEDKKSAERYLKILESRTYDMNTEYEVRCTA